VARTPDLIAKSRCIIALRQGCVRPCNRRIGDLGTAFGGVTEVSSRLDFARAAGDGSTTGITGGALRGYFVNGGSAPDGEVHPEQWGELSHG